jgi:glutathione S-transferase
MPVDPRAAVEVTAYKWVPPQARGYVKDMRVRWALEEIGQPYCVRLIGGIFREQSPDYLADQPFGQVPVYKDGDLTLFESGAILIHIGETDERLLPRDPAGRGRAIAWMFAALNSVEPALQTLRLLRITGDGHDWQVPAYDAARPFAVKRLEQLERALGDREWLEGRFTIGDLVMLDVLRNLPEPDMLASQLNLAAYVAHGTSRPAFGRAMAAQLADFTDPD